MVITSKQNSAVKELAALKEKKGRRESGTFLVEGRKMVTECAKSGMEIVRLAVREGTDAPDHGCPVLTLGEDAFRAVCDEKSPQGIVAEVRIPNHALMPPTDRCLFLDGVADPANVGAIIRTAVAAGYTELYLSDCADPYAPKSVRASMSGVFFARIMQGTREDLFKVLEGVPMIAADMDGESVFDFTPPETFCLCIGSEARGLSDETRARANHTVKIPMDARTESLNAAVSAGILMYILRYFK